MSVQNIHFLRLLPKTCTHHDKYNLHLDSDQVLFLPQKHNFHLLIAVGKPDNIHVMTMFDVTLIKLTLICPSDSCQTIRRLCHDKVRSYCYHDNIASTQMGVKQTYFCAMTSSDVTYTMTK